MREFLAKPVDGSSLAVFRIGFGILMAFLVYGFLAPTSDGVRLIDLLGTANDGWSFSYPGLAWWKPLPSTAMEGVAWTCIACALLLALGFFTQLAAATVFGTFLYLWTCDASLFGNHFPLATVFAFLLIVVPSNRYWSWDSFRHPMPRSVPFWSILVLRAQVFLIYFFGGVSKLHPDWLHGEPMRTWFHSSETAESLRNSLGGPVAEQILLPILRLEGTVYFFAYGGLLFDLSIGIFLCLRRTRLLALLVVTMFHGFNYLFVDKVGVVAPMSWWATLLFLDAQWPVRVWNWIKVPRIPAPDLGWFLGGMIAVPLLGAALGWKLPPSKPLELGTNGARISWPLAALLVIWLALQTLIPLRHFVITGDAYWTEEGVAFSWFLLTRNKSGDFLQFRIVDTDAESALESGLEDRLAHGKALEFVSVDVRKLGESDLPAMPEIFAIFEPVLGYRVFCRWKSDKPGDEAEFRRTWRQQFSSEPRLVPVRMADESLRDLRSLVTNHSGQDEVIPLQVARFTREIDFALANLTEVRESRSNDPHRRVALQRLHRSLERLWKMSAESPPLQAPLLEAAPFSFQGASIPTDSIRLILDPQSPYPVGGASLQVAWRAGSIAQPVVYCDFSILPCDWLDLLPPIIPIRENSSHAFLWNYTHELNAKQIEAMGIFPYLIRQYAEHVADQWQGATGRGPKVFVNAYGWLNTHEYRPLIDPTANLAAARYHLLRHNEWILPMEDASAGSSGARSERALEQ